jgi:hypothetical protein
MHRVYTRTGHAKSANDGNRLVAMKIRVQTKLVTPQRDSILQPKADFLGFIRDEQTIFLEVVNADDGMRELPGRNSQLSEDARC